MVSGSTGGIASANRSPSIPSCRDSGRTDFEQRSGLLQKDDGRGQQRAEQRAGEDLAKDIAAEKPHGLPRLPRSPAPGPPAASAVPLRPDAVPDRRSGSKAPPRRPRWRNPAPPISANGAALSINSKTVSSSPAARMSFSERAFKPRKRTPRTSSSRPSGRPCRPAAACSPGCRPDWPP